MRASSSLSISITLRGGHETGPDLRRNQLSKSSKQIQIENERVQISGANLAGRRGLTGRQENDGAESIVGPGARGRRRSRRSRTTDPSAVKDGGALGALGGRRRLPLSPVGGRGRRQRLSFPRARGLSQVKKGCEHEGPSSQRNTHAIRSGERVWHTSPSRIRRPR